MIIPFWYHGVNTLSVFYLYGIYWLNAGMNINEIRRYNLWIIVHPFGYSDQGVKLFSEKTGKTEQRIRHLIAKTPDTKTAKNIGSAAAREFETILGLKNGWLDQAHYEEWEKKGLLASSKDFFYNITGPVENKLMNDDRVPLISWVQAGGFCEAIDINELGGAEDWERRPKGAGIKTYALKVRGDSMTSPFPAKYSYPEGVIIYVDPDQEVKPGDRGIFKLPENNEVTFKELVSDAGKLYLKPLNPQYDKIEVTEDMITCGRVIGMYLPE